MVLLESELIIMLSFFGVDEVGVCIGHFFEDFLGVYVGEGVTLVLILIRMEPKRECPICLLDFSIGGSLLDSKNVIIIFLSHFRGDIVFHLLLLFVHHLLFKYYSFTTLSTTSGIHINHTSMQQPKDKNRHLQRRSRSKTYSN